MLKNFHNILFITLITGGIVFSLSGCALFGGSGGGNDKPAATETAEEDVSQETVEATLPSKLSSLEFDHEIVMDKAQFLSIDAYKDGYYVITSHKNGDFYRLLIVPEGKEAPERLDEDIIVVKQPVNTSKIDNLTALGLLGDIREAFLDKVSLVANDKGDIYVNKVVENMDNGITKYAGPATKPDTNLIKENMPQLYLCNPGLKKEAAFEEYVKTGLKPFITYTPHETDPLGRIEWAKALGVIYGDLERADKFYQEQKALAESIDTSKAQDKTYAMICLKKDENKAYVRRGGCAFAKTGELAGAKNVLAEIQKNGWEEMSIDDFISRFKDTDLLIYLDKHGDKVENLDDLKGISEKLLDMKAVQEKNLWRTHTDYLIMNNLGDVAKELNEIFAGKAEVVNFVRI